jgi:putative transposase
LDNVFVERLWRSVKDLESGLSSYFWFYDEERPHQSLDYQTPGEVYRVGRRTGLRGVRP